MRLPCEKCGALHIDEGEFAVKPHHTHTCQRCGLTWRPAIEPTVGVLFLPGYQNYPPPEPLPEWRPHPMGAQQGEGKASVGLGSQAPDAAAVEGEPFFRYVTQSPFHKNQQVWIKDFSYSSRCISRVRDFDGGNDKPYLVSTAWGEGSVQTWEWYHPGELLTKKPATEPT